MRLWKLTIIFFELLITVFFFSSCNPSSSKNEKRIRAIDTIPLLVPDSLYLDLDQILISRKQHQLDSIFRRLVRLTGFNGTVLYTEKGRLVFEKAYGFADVRRKRDSLQLDSQFELASVSKMFTAMAVMILRQDGLLEYDVDIRKYIPEWPYEGVTVRHLLNHRSGLSRYQSLAHEKWTDKTIPLTNEKDRKSVV